MKIALPAVVFALMGQTALAGDTALWVLATVDGVAAGYVATLDLSQEGRLTGQAPCNRYFADMALQAEALDLGPIGATKMACEAMQGESDYFATLGQMDSLIRSEGALTLRGAGHEMVFAPQAD